MARAEPAGPNGAPPKVILVAPPPVARLSAFAEMFGGATEKSRNLAERYREVAERQGVGFVDAGQFIACSDLDGIHFEADQHTVLGHAMAEAVRIMVG
jgi:lysophospholipase L1-like esterase